jgi:DNA-binding response OmpR family regulator
MFLSAKSEVSSKVLGFSLGADDYIVKPCDPSELRARVEAKIRWTRVESENSRVLRQGPFTFFLDMQRLDINHEGQEASINLTPLEFKLLYYLASHKDHIISREQILDGVWGKSTNVLDRSVDTYVASLRRKMGDYKRCLRSVHGVGYKFSLDELAQKKAS